MSYDHHDWAWEEGEAEDYAQEKEDHAWAVDFNQWRSFAYPRVDRDTAVNQSTSGLMADALEWIFDHHNARFRIALFKAYCSNEHLPELRDLLADALLLAYRKDRAVA